MQQIRVAIVEDNKAFREGLITMLAMNRDLVLAGAYANAAGFIDDLGNASPDVVLMDIQMPGMTGVEASKILLARQPSLRIIIQTAFEDDDYIFNAICNGAVGYILKQASPAEYLQAIQDAYEGGSPMTPRVAARVLSLFRASQQKQLKQSFELTPRELEVLGHLVKGLSYKMIAAQCDITYDTVRFHIKNIYAKLRVESMTEAVAMAIRNAIV